MSGLVHIYCGDGKGKTTAALGLVMRCCGSGGKVLVCRFMKNDESGEVNILRTLPNVELEEGYADMKFSFKMNREEKLKASEFFISLLNRASDKMQRTSYDLVVMDELLSAVGLGFVPYEPAREFITSKPENTELVLTGRHTDGFLELADYVSEIKKLKHPYDKGTAARKYIEF